MAGDGRVIVSVSGVRGVIGAGLTPELAAGFAAALDNSLPSGPVVVGRDSRPSGAMLLSAVAAGLASAGRDVIDAGIQPTPTLGRAVRVLGTAGGVQVTASHNPPEWNGLKMFGPDGAVLSAEGGRAVKRRFETGDASRAPWDRVGRVSAAPDVAAEHVARVLEVVPSDAVRRRRFRVLLDANGGAGAAAGRRLLEQLGCDTVPVGCGMDGDFAHAPEPVPEHLTGVGPRVAAAGCDLGFVLDPDSDRLAIIDALGRPIGEELTLALATLARLRERRGPVVINLSTSRVTEDVARSLGCPCERAAVGEANVVGLLRERDAVIGGEGNGGVIDPRIGWVRDPFVGMALVLKLLADEGRSLADVVATLPTYHIVKDKVAVAPAGLPAAFARLEKHWSAWSADRRDGLRLDGPDGWVQVRASNTEPVVRVIAEAGREDDARRYCREAGRLLAG
jgi:phosphomannomutase